MGPFIEAILGGWQHQRDYAERLVRDIPRDRMLAQPIAGVTMNHPAWILSHLSVYPPVLRALLTKSDDVADPAEHPHGKNSKPLDDPAAYKPRDELIEGYLTAHDGVNEALSAADIAVLTAPPALERWRERFDTLAHVVVHVMIHHESVHLGQLSAWRRAMGMPVV